MKDCSSTTAHEQVLEPSHNRTFADPVALINVTDLAARGDANPNHSHPAPIQEEETTISGLDHHGDYPDGGWSAWLVVLGGACASMGAFGLGGSIGAFQTYYEQHLFTSYSSSQVAWIGSVQTTVCFSICLVTGPLFDRYSPRPLLVAGTVLLVFGFCMLSLATKYYQVFLCHAGPIALGMNLVFLVPMSAVGHWFYRRRGFAFGILMAGSSFGSILWPLLIAELPPKIGWSWSMRVLELALGILGVISSILVKARLPPKPRGPFFHLQELKNVAYTCVSVAYPVNSFGFLPFLTFIGTYGNVVGIRSFSPYLLMINNGASGVGRILGGVAADHYGVFNVGILACFGMAVLMFAWMAMKTAGELVALCIIYGFLSGFPVSLQATMLTAVISDPQRTGTLIGQSIVLEGLTAAVTAPLFGLIVGTGTAEEKLANFKNAIAFGGAMLALSAILFIPARLKLSRKLWAVA